MLELIDDSRFYDLKHPSGAVFKLRYWTFGMQEEVDKNCIVQDERGVRYLISLEREIKIRLAVADWTGITLNGTDAPCTQENKNKLPVGVVLWLVRDIDERSGIRMPEEEKKN